MKKKNPLEEIEKKKESLYAEIENLIAKFLQELNFVCRVSFNKERQKCKTNDQTLKLSAKYFIEEEVEQLKVVYDQIDLVEEQLAGKN